MRFDRSRDGAPRRVARIPLLASFGVTFALVAGLLAATHLTPQPAHASGEVINARARGA